MSTKSLFTSIFLAQYVLFLINELQSVVTINLEYMESVYSGKMRNPSNKLLCEEAGMKVIDSENWAWLLFEHEGNLYLDAYCNMSAFGYTYMIQLNDQEQKKYEIGGREYLKKLAYDIHYSVPITKDTKSIYKGRDVSKLFSELATEAVKTWRENNNGK